MTRRKWKIFYADGSTFDSSQGGPGDAPARGVAIVQVEDGSRGRRTLRMQDWYRWCPAADRWFDGDAWSVLRELTRHGQVIALPGEYMLEADFEQIMIAAHEDRFIAPISPDTPAHPAWRFDT